MLQSQHINKTRIPFFFSFLPTQQGAILPQTWQIVESFLEGGETVFLITFCKCKQGCFDVLITCPMTNASKGEGAVFFVCVRTVFDISPFFLHGVESTECDYVF